MTELYPICRSITGNGVRDSLKILQRYIPIKIHEVPTGTKAFDWTVPKEWNIKDGWIKDASGKKIIDFKSSNLHVLNYSAPIKNKIGLEELKEHIFTDLDHPDWIPYRTSYYQETWGFCMAHHQFIELSPGQYEVNIDTTLKNGHLTYGEYFIKGESDEEMIISCHICHPSLCNDNLSGITLATFLARQMRQRKLKKSFRFLFIPGTIGSIVWLSRNEHLFSNIKQGLVLANLGDNGPIVYKKSRIGNSELDKTVEFVLKNRQVDYSIRDFMPYGYDERQYCSPGINLPVGRITRTPHNEYPEYHTSADNLDFVDDSSLAVSLEILLEITELVDGNRKYMNLQPKCEPQLGRRGLYEALGGKSGDKINQLAMLWVLNYSDGEHSLLDISNRSNIEFKIISDTADLLRAHGLLEEVVYR